jgi:hypothetical protein
VKVIAGEQARREHPRERVGEVAAGELGAHVGAV